MKANELRIGNLIQVKGEIITVDDIINCGGGVWGIDSDYGTPKIWGDDIEPIPLTEEWLVKFGFQDYEPKHEYFVGYYLPYKDGRGVLCEFPIARADDGYYLATDSIDTLEIEYTFQKPVTSVHELQNLFFALTGEELEIKN